MKYPISIYFLAIISVSHAFFMRPNTFTTVAFKGLRMKLDDKQSHWISTSIKKGLVLATLIPALALADPQIPTTTTMESAVLTLEQAQGRDNTLQALDSLYSTAETKSSIVKAKYKYRIVSALKEKKVQLNQDWDKSLSVATEEVRRRIDPYHSVDIADYLKIAPVVGGVCYLGALVVQNILPELFIFAYPAAVGVFLAPILFKIFTS